MPKRVAEVGEGNEDNHGVYGFIRDLIVEGRDARFVNKRGRYVISWSKALDRYVDFKSKKNPQFKCKKFNRRKASNGLRAALLNFYKKEGAREYKESKKVNDKDEVVERQFQMPPRVFESLFKNVKLADDSEPDEQDTSSIKSEGESEAQSPSHSSTSDAGFDETMDMTIEGTSGIEADTDDSTNIPDNPSLNVVKTEEDGDVFLPDTIRPSEMFDTSAVDSALEEICSDGISDDISDDLDLLGVVQDICPMSGSVKGGYQFYVSLTEQLPDNVTTGIVQFEGVADVEAQKLNPYTLSGIVPPSHQPGDVPVRVLTAAGQCLGMTCFSYIDEMREMVRQIVKDRTLQLLWVSMWSQEHGFFGDDSDISQVLGAVNLPNQDSSSQTKQQQSVKILQLLVYTAAETDARQFIDMIFSTSAGKIIFNSYKDKTLLPEDIARANGHEDLARYLQDLNIRLSKEAGIEAQPKAIDWSELVKAVQTQASVSEEEPSSQQKCPSESDDKSSDYFADGEMSSCGSFDLDEANQSDSEDKDSCDEGFCTKDAASKEEPNKRPATSMREPTNDKQEKLSDNKVEKDSPRWWHSYSLSEWLNKWRKSKTTSPMPPECGQNNHKRSPKRTATGLKYKWFLLAFAMVTVLAGLKLREGNTEEIVLTEGNTKENVSHWAVSVYKDSPHCCTPVFLKKTALHPSAKRGFKLILVLNGTSIYVRDFRYQETLVYLALPLPRKLAMVRSLKQHEGEIKAHYDKWQKTTLIILFVDKMVATCNISLQHRIEVSENNDLMVQKGHTMIECSHSAHTCVPTVQKEWKTMLLHDTWSLDWINVYNCTGGILALDLCQTGVLISSDRKRFKTRKRKEKEAWKNSTEEDHLQMIVLPCRNRTVDMKFEMEAFHRTQRSAHQGNASYYQMCSSFSTYAKEIPQNETNGLLMDDVVFLTVSPSSDECQQHRVINSTDQCQEQSRVESLDQSHKDSTLNSSDHDKQTRIKMGKLVRMVGAILVVCLVVACLLWYKYQFRVLTTNGSTEPHVSPCPEPLLGPGMVDLANTSNTKTLEEYLQGLSIVDIPMEKASIKKLQLERVRPWLNRDLETEVSLLSNVLQEISVSPALEIKAGVPSEQELYDLSVEV